MNTDLELHPDQPLRCLLVQPEFSATNFWYMKDALENIGAKTNSPPLGLLTVAALVPQNWQFRLLDLNVRNFTEDDWEWAQIICVGGMLPQQEGILACIDAAKSRGKYVVVGGADPTSQPDIYQSADARVLGEGEVTIPLWLESWRQGQAKGMFYSDKKPDVTQSPIPRYDLINFPDYLQVTVQYSRGCPFNCEFCDIIELYGRVPRTKSALQVTKELEVLYDLGYRGWIDIVDDNFIGNKRNVKQMLPVLEEWCKSRKYPFFFSTEASMNLADDKKLMQLMQAVDFRFVFMGIETPDPELLLHTQKSQNTMKPIVERVHQLYKYGISASAGFILGFDGEKKGVDRAMIRCIEDTGIAVAMVGLLVALPNTQLTRRLLKEGRLLDVRGSKVDPSTKDYRVSFKSGRENSPQGRDQTTAGLNFITSRDRKDILDEFSQVVQYIYHPKIYMNRVLRTVRALKMKQLHKAKGWELRRNLKGLYHLCRKHTKNPDTRWYFWRNFVLMMFMGPARFEMGMLLMGSYLHLEKSVRHMSGEAESAKAGMGTKEALREVYLLGV